MFVRFSDRSLSRVVVLPGVSWQVKRMEWELEGGPSKAVVTGKTEAGRSAAGVFGLLRCEAVISTKDDGPVWWGYVHAVSVGGYRVSLDSLANRIKVRYRDERPVESVNVGWQKETAWVSDAYSTGQWGIKEAVYSMQEAQDNEAGALAGQKLAERKRPALTPDLTSDLSPTQRGGVVELELRGWWSTLDWRYFSESRGAIGFSGGGATVNLGQTGILLAAQRFTTGATGWVINGFWARIGKYGNPTEYITGELRTESAGVPGYPAVATSPSYHYSVFPSETGWVKFTFTSGYTLAAGTNYYACMGLNTPSATNYYRLSADETMPLGGSTLWIWNGSGWVRRSPDANVVFWGVGDEVTTTQVVTMASQANGGQFLRGVVIKNGSTHRARLYRTGRLTALVEVREMLNQGDGAGGRLMGQVTQERVLVVESVPSMASPELMVLPGGEVRRRDGGRVALGARVVGRWARIQGVDQLGGDVGVSGYVLVRRAVWDAARGVVTVEWEA